MPELNRETQTTDIVATDMFLAGMDLDPATEAPAANLELSSTTVVAVAETKQEPVKEAPKIDIKERNRLVLSCHPMAYKLAYKFSNKFDVPTDLCVESAEDALIKAAGKFEPERGFKFMTYAYKCVYFTLVRVTTRYNAKKNLTVSGDTPRSDEDSRTLFDKLQNDNNSTAEEQNLKLSQTEKLREAMSRLSEEQRKIIDMLFIQEKTLKEVGEVLGVSKQAVANRRDKVIALLQEELPAAA